MVGVYTSLNEARSIQCQVRHKRQTLDIVPLAANSANIFFSRLLNGFSMEQHALKSVNSCLNTNIYSYLETSVGQSSNPYLNVVHFLNTRAD
jgi:hypothetical protein